MGIYPRLTSTLLTVSLLSLQLFDPGCARPAAVQGYPPASVARGGEGAAPALRSAPRPRAQHTFGSVGEDLFPVLGPDTRTLYFSSSRQGPRFAVFKKPLGASAVTSVTGGPWSDLHPALSPDGRSLAFASDREGTFAIFVKDEADGGSLRRVSRPGGPEALGPSWAPDSRRLAFFRRHGEETAFEVYTLDVETGEEQVLGAGHFPSWSPDGPDGQWIAYQLAGEEGGWSSIWKMRPDGSRRTRLILNESWGAVHPSWSPDARWIAFAAVGKSPAGARPAAGERGDDLYLISADGSNLINLTADRGGVAEWNPSFGPDGRIYFDSDEGGAVNIWSLDPGVRSPSPALQAVTADRRSGFRPR